jgi:hypothetical protein
VAISASAHADEVDQALLDFIRLPAQADRQHNGAENRLQSPSQNGQAD